MKIAVTSQNRKTVTGHAGKCRKFWVYEVDHAEARSRSLLELPLGQTFHATHAAEGHPLDGINVLITASLGTGLQQRLKRKGILAVATPETDPDRAVAAWLNGTLVEVAPEDHGTHHHDHSHRHSHH